LITVTTKYEAMNDQTLRIIMWVGAILFSIIGFFIVRYINRTTRKQDENAANLVVIQQQLTESINKLQLSITGLNGIMLSIQQGSDTFAKGCTDKHTKIDRKLEDHEQRLIEHDRKIVVMEVKVGG
jgi:hypothetical protein